MPASDPSDSAAARLRAPDDCERGAAARLRRAGGARRRGRRRRRARDALIHCTLSILLHGATECILKVPQHAHEVTGSVTAAPHLHIHTALLDEARAGRRREDGAWRGGERSDLHEHERHRPGRRQRARERAVCQRRPLLASSAVWSITHTKQSSVGCISRARAPVCMAVLVRTCSPAWTRARYACRPCAARCARTAGHRALTRRRERHPHARPRQHGRAGGTHGVIAPLPPSWPPQLRRHCAARRR